METASKINEILTLIQKRNHFTDQQLADYAGVSRWTIYRIRKGVIGETVSTNLIGVILREQFKQPTEQVA
jgi:predicted DNA-binding transcriptional regulator YafY